jgi:antitoxin (DNA-binding transcriptional repressor) of toxin-antitoxin stability system
MVTVGLKVLKNKLSEYIRAAAAGETVLVTDRDRVVAEIGPPRSATAAVPLSEEQFIDDLVHRGLATKARRQTPLPPRSTPIMTLEELLVDLDESRADR